MLFPLLPRDLQGLVIGLEGPHETAADPRSEFPLSGVAFLPDAKQRTHQQNDERRVMQHRSMIAMVVVMMMVPAYACIITCSESSGPPACCH